MDFLKKISNKGKIKYGALLAGLLALVLSIVIILNVIVTILGNRYNWFFDMTDEQFYSASDSFVDAMKKAWPDVEIKVMAAQLPSCRGGMGANYGASLPFCHYYEIAHYLFELNLAYQEWALEDGYKDFMEFINLTSQFDSEYGYPHIFNPVNTRSSEVEWFDTNGFHPSTSGCMQIADAVYRNLIATLNRQAL